MSETTATPEAAPATEEPKQEIEQSESLAELTKAMVAANANFTHPKLNTENEFLKTKYANLSSVIDAYRPAYTAAGLVITQIVTRTKLTTIVAHTSGEFLRFHIDISPAKTGIQAFGSQLTYLRRYTILALTGIAAGDDDDGEGEPPAKESFKAPPAKKAPPVKAKAPAASKEKAKAEPDDGSPSLIDLMLGAATKEELDGLLPQFKGLTGEARENAIAVYRSHTETLAKQASK